MKNDRDALADAIGIMFSLLVSEDNLSERGREKIRAFLQDETTPLSVVQAAQLRERKLQTEPFATCPHVWVNIAGQAGIGGTRCSLCGISRQAFST